VLGVFFVGTLNSDLRPFVDKRKLKFYTLKKSFRMDNIVIKYKVLFNSRGKTCNNFSKEY